VSGPALTPFSYGTGPKATIPLVAQGERQAGDCRHRLFCRCASADTTDESGHFSLLVTSAENTAGAVVGRQKVMITLGAPAAANDTQPTFHKQGVPWRRTAVRVLQSPHQAREAES